MIPFVVIINCWYGAHLVECYSLKDLIFNQKGDPIFTQLRLNVLIKNQRGESDSEE